MTRSFLFSEIETEHNGENYTTEDIATVFYKCVSHTFYGLLGAFGIVIHSDFQYGDFSSNESCTKYKDGLEAITAERGCLKNATGSIGLDWIAVQVIASYCDYPDADCSLSMSMPSPPCFYNRKCYGETFSTWTGRKLSLLCQLLGSLT